MSDQQVQNVPGQVAGTTPAQVSAEGQSPTTAVTSTQEPASQTGQEAKPVTAQDLVALEERLAKQIQSQVDKRDTRVNKRMTEIDSAVALLRGQGTEISDDKVKAMKQNAATEAMIEPAQETIDTQTVDPLDASKWDPQNPLTTVAKRMMANKQLTLDAGDPEAKMIDYSDGAAWLISLESALNAKSVRLKSPPKQEEPKSNTNAAARIPASGGSSGGEPAKSGREYLKRAHKED